MHTRETCKLYSKLTIKGQAQRLMLLLLATHFPNCSTVIIGEFDQISAGLA